MTATARTATSPSGATRVGLVTTLDTNIGDDFIRAGIVRLLNDPRLDLRPGDAVAVNKHLPLSVYPRRHPLRWFGAYRKRGASRVWDAASALLSPLGRSSFHACDAIVQCGAPVLWPRCHHNEWARPLWYDVIGRIHDRVPVLNLAGGSAFPWEHRPETFEDAEDAAYARDIGSFCRLTTARDPLAAALWASVGIVAPVLPCTAFLALEPVASPSARPPVVLVNYMTGGGHFEWSQAIDPDTWRRELTAVLDALKPRYTVEFVCHNDEEVRLARALDPSLPVHIPKSVAAYQQLAGSASAAVVNRLHAAVALAGIGVPSVSVGTDTRMLMVRELGLPVHYVKDASAPEIVDRLEGFLRAPEAERERLLALRGQTVDRYLSLLEPVLRPNHRR